MTTESWATDERSARLLLENVTDYAIYMLDVQGLVVSWNPGAQAIKGYTADEVLGKHFSMFFTESDREAAEPERELLAAVDGRSSVEGWRLRKNGERFWAGVVLTAIRDGDRLVGFAKVTRDLSERRAHEEQRIRLARVEEALQLRNEFFESARSALDSTLVSIRVHLRSLVNTVDSLSDDAAQTKLQVLGWGLDRLAKSIDRVTDVANTTSRHLEQYLAKEYGANDKAHR
jgi:PAS domain S-box-containing protein